jgi:tetratricopeptide (TPR) repeat protein
MANKLCELGRAAQVHHLVGKGEGDLDMMTDFFRQAQSADPGCVPAYVGLGEAYRLQYEFGRRTPEVRNLMTENYEKAYTLNSDLAETNAGLGWCDYYRRSYAQASEHFRRAKDIAPGDLKINFAIAAYLAALGLPSKAAAYCGLLIGQPGASSIVYELRAECFVRMGEYAAALDDAGRIVDMRPREASARSLRARILVLMRRFTEAAEDVDAAEKLAPGTIEPRLARALLAAATGDRALAEECLEAALGKPVVYTDVLSRVYAALGMKDKALENIDLAVKSGLSSVEACAYPYEGLANGKDYFLDPLRGDRRFEAILKSRQDLYKSMLTECRGL